MLWKSFVCEGSRNLLPINVKWVYWRKISGIAFFSQLSLLSGIPGGLRRVTEMCLIWGVRIWGFVLIHEACISPRWCNSPSPRHFININGFVSAVPGDTRHKKVTGSLSPAQNRRRGNASLQHRGGKPARSPKFLTCPSLAPFNPILITY